MDRIFLLWQSNIARKWHTIGCLSKKGEKYLFNYVNGLKAAQNEGFSLIYEFPEKYAMYISNSLPSFFQNRLLSRNRPEFNQYLNWANISGMSKLSDLELLTHRFARRIDDQYMLFRTPEKINEEYSINFFIHGARYRSEVKYENLIEDNVTTLSLEAEFDNEYDDHATLIYINSDDLFGKKYLGYVPRFLSEDIRYLMTQTKLNLEIEKINLSPTPYRYRCLVSLKCKWPNSFRPFEGDKFIGLLKKPHVEQADNSIPETPALFPEIKTN